MLGLTRYQWTVLFAAWLGWGFDIFDSLLFNFVAPNCIPTLLHLPLGSKAAAAATSQWTGMLTSLLLLGWAGGGVLFGYLGDRLGRMRTLMLTMLMYAAGTAACAFAPNIGTLVVFRVIASLGIGGEWAAGAAMVAEVVPERRRVEAGALLYTAASFGVFLATFLNYQIAGHWFVGNPERSWRYLFLFGLVPAAVAFGVRSLVREPERWQQVAGQTTVRLRELFVAPLGRVTFWGTFAAVVALVTWWSSNAFINPTVTGLARVEATARGLSGDAVLSLIESWKLHANLYFASGGLVGTLLVIPLARVISRRLMFALYFACSAVAMLCTFGLSWEPETRLQLYFVVGVPVFGIFGAFPFYLTELFPTRLRTSGAGFCYNIGRVITSIGPFVVGTVAARGSALQTIFYVGFVPLVGLLFAPFFIETRDKALED